MDVNLLIYSYSFLFLFLWFTHNKIWIIANNQPYYLINEISWWGDQEVSESKYLHSTMLCSKSFLKGMLWKSYAWCRINRCALAFFWKSNAFKKDVSMAIDKHGICSISTK